MIDATMWCANNAGVTGVFVAQTFLLEVIFQSMTIKETAMGTIHRVFDRCVPDVDVSYAPHILNQMTGEMLIGKM
jgi:hypothetical protein